MKIRKSALSDIDEILIIYEFAKKYMRKNGNNTQWNDSYPSRSIIENDIRNNNSYCIIGDDGNINATFMFSIGKEPTYDKIYDGEWINNNMKYGVIHRIASDGKIKSVFSNILDFCIKKYPNIRIDTHKDNKKMIELLYYHNFNYCGIIYVEDGSERLAFQQNFKQD